MAFTRRMQGFTLVEVMVALVIMAVLATMAWQGVDGLVRAREGAARSGEAALRLGTVLAQWEQDLGQIQQSNAAPGLKFDGSSLRITRRVPGGIQVVVWTLQGRTLYRWAAPASAASGVVGGENEALPSGVRLVLALPAGPLTRDLLVRPSQ